jgi:hypothetical protein
MSRATAERWVVISAVVTLGIYAYRRLAGAPAAPGGLANIINQKPPVKLGQFTTAWGFTYLIIAVMAEAAPGLGGGFAILVMTGDLLANIGNVLGQVQQQEKQQEKAPATVVGVAQPGTPQAAAQAQTAARVATSIHYVPGTSAGGVTGAGRF